MNFKSLLISPYEREETASSPSFCKACLPAGREGWAVQALRALRLE